MTKIVKLRRGTSQQHQFFVGDEGELTINTDKDIAVVHDGTTAGGQELVGVSASQRLTNKDIVATNLVVSGISTFVGVTTHQQNLFGTQASFTGVVTATTLKDSIGNVRALPQNSQTSAYILASSDAGKLVSITTGGVTVPADVFATGDVISVYNNSTSVQSITQGASTTLRLAATATTGSRFLSQYGVCSVICVASNTFVISGAGVT
jgi:hypothetical protein